MIHIPYDARRVVLPLSYKVTLFSLRISLWRWTVRLYTWTMSKSPLLPYISPLALSPSSPKCSSSEDDPILRKASKASNVRRPAILSRRLPVSPRAYICCIGLIILCLVSRALRSYFAVRQLTAKIAANAPDGEYKHGATKIIQVGYTGAQAGNGSIKIDTDADFDEDPTLWLASKTESRAGISNATWSEDKRIRSLRCPNSTDVVLVLITSSTAPAALLQTYFSQIPCIKPNANLAVYSDSPSLISLPYPFSDCTSCNARTTVPIHDAIGLTSLNFTVPREIARLHETLLQHQAHGFGVEGFADHKIFAEMQKYRLLTALFHAYHEHPRKQWFTVATPSVHVSMRNIVLWASRLSPKSPVYAGANMLFEGREFAALDAGIVLNREALGRLVKYAGWEVLPAVPAEVEEVQRSNAAAIQRPVQSNGNSPRRHRSARPGRDTKETYGSRWYQNLSASVHADVALASAFHDVGVNITRSFPLMRPNALMSIEWKREVWSKAFTAIGKMDGPQHEMVAGAERRTLRRVSVLIGRSTVAHL